MSDLKIYLDGRGVWEGDDGRLIHHVVGGWEIARMPGGMSSGKSSVMFRIELPNGDVVMAETSLVLLAAAVQAFKGREAVEGAESA